MRKLKDVGPPTGLSRALYRLPIALYAIRLGSLLGSRFLLLEHTGRRTGRTRRVVLEVARHDAATDTWYVASGWGERSQWYRNLQARPRAVIRVGGRRLPVEARTLPLAAAEDEMVRYGRMHPRAARGVARLVGYEIDGSEADLRALAGVLRIVAFSPLGPSA